MDARQILTKLRRKQSLSRDDLSWFATGLADGRVSDAQAGAFAMGICINGLGDVGRVALTLAMRDSGKVMDWSDLGRPVLDKHSTGGLGDSVSLILAPALVACGALVPMISGRGLGHTGGTLDKLESIPGLQTGFKGAEFRAIVEQVGTAIVGASSDIAPADKRLYAVRDISATVESLDLITASILSKKLAAGLDGLVLDVKVGSGAFMKGTTEAIALARALVRTANAAGCKTAALITDMNQPLLPSVGNALEVAEVARVLTGNARGPILDLTATLGGVVLHGAGLAEDVEDGAEKIARSIRKGNAAEVFGRMVAAQGGPIAFIDNWSRFLPEATVIHEVPAPQSGYVTAIDGEALGLAVVRMGGGRHVETDTIDPSVGFSGLARIGDRVGPGSPLATVHAALPEDADRAIKALQSATTIEAGRVSPPELVHDMVA